MYPKKVFIYFMLLLSGYSLIFSNCYGRRDRNSNEVEFRLEGSAYSKTLGSMVDREFPSQIGIDKEQGGDYKLFDVMLSDESKSCYENGKSQLEFTGDGYRKKDIRNYGCDYNVTFKFKKAIDPTPSMAYRNITAIDNGSGNLTANVSFSSIDPYKDKLVAELTLSSTLKDKNALDRVVFLYTRDKNNQPIEIARFVTPYAISGVVYKYYSDISSYIGTLTDPSRASKLIIARIGDPTGEFRYSLKFYVIKRETPLEKAPIEVEKLYEGVRLSDDDINSLGSKILPVSNPSSYSKIDILMRMTGHGTAEFAKKSVHSLNMSSINSPNLTAKIDFVIDSDCLENGMSIQGGSAGYSRQGWCPGQPVMNRFFEIPANMMAESSLKINYSIPIFNPYRFGNTAVPAYAVSIHAIKYGPTKAPVVVPPVVVPPVVVPPVVAPPVVAPPTTVTRELTCVSNKYKRATCELLINGKGPKSVTLIQQLPGSRECKLDKNFGTTTNGIYVDNNCQGNFLLTY